jgi:gamma-glutamylputrescine oxidase
MVSEEVYCTFYSNYSKLQKNGPCKKDNAMRSPLLPQDQVFWYLNQQNIQPLRNNITADVVVIGGGMAGLSAAQAFHEKGKSVVVLEKNYCGSGASGKSSGFITPDSEIALEDLVATYGLQRAREIWEFITSGTNKIRDNILTYNIACDYQNQDTLVLASTVKAYVKTIEKEAAVRAQLGYASTVYSAQQLPTHLGSEAYYGGIAYGGSFGINSYRYCCGMKDVLTRQGVQIYEETPALALTAHSVRTPYATVTAKHIVVCADYAAPVLGGLQREVYHAQTFLMISSVLSDAQAQALFPQQRYMVWDTDLIYNYFRLTGDNRLLFGGASLLYTYAASEKHNSHWIKNKLTRYVQQKFPQLEVTFEYIWPGLIGISKDLVPLAGSDPANPSHYYIAAAAGLPWAAALGMYSAQRLVDNNTHFDDYLSPQRKYPLPSLFQSVFGTRLTFALSNFMRVGSL